MDFLRVDEKKKWIGSQQLFENVPDEVLEALVPHFRARTFPAHKMVMLELQSSNAICLIAKGTVKVCLVRGGRETLLNICGSGEVLGEVSLLDGRGHSADIETLEETTVLWVEQGVVAQYLDRYPRLGTNIARILSRRLRLATTRIEALTTLDVPGRVARQLVAFAGEYGQPNPNGSVTIPLCLTQSDLAALLGASRPRVNQVLSALKRANIIEVGKNQHITVLNHEALAKRSVETSSSPGLAATGN